MKGGKWREGREGRAGRRCGGDREGGEGREQMWRGKRCIEEGRRGGDMEEEVVEGMRGHIEGGEGGRNKKGGRIGDNIQ